MNRDKLREALIAGVESSGYLPCHASEQVNATLAAVRKYADEREANGRRGRTVHSIRIASDLRRILDGADTERPEPTGLEGE